MRVMRAGNILFKWRQNLSETFRIKLFNNLNLIFNMILNSRPNRPASVTDENGLLIGANYLGFFSSLSLKTREKYTSFAQ